MGCITLPSRLNKHSLYQVMLREYGYSLELGLRRASAPYHTPSWPNTVCPRLSLDLAAQLRLRRTKSEAHSIASALALDYGGCLGLDSFPRLSLLGFVYI